MRHVFSLAILVTTFVSCAQPAKTNVEQEYPRQVADIAFDPNLDDPSFKVCDVNSAQQYYNFGRGLLFKGEKAQLNKYFMTNFKPQEDETQTGFITIRFIVNCEGKTGWFRIQGMDYEYLPKEFDSDLTLQLLGLTKKLEGWIAGEHNGKFYDFYQYLTFKIESGKLIEIMP